MSGLYVHIPFCHSKCAYCDFYSLPRLDSIADYVRAIPQELILRRDEILSREPFSTLYFGGGTPSILPIPIFNDLIGQLRNAVDLSGLSEFTVEANPEDLTDEWLDNAISLGVSRVSIGVQSFDDSQLAEICRRHDSRCAVAALERLQKAGINHNADLIYGLPGQSLQSWQSSLDRLLSFRPHHISAYSLMYEPGTRLYARLQSGKIEEASDSLVQEMYQYLCDATRTAGYEHYEISNFSLPGYHSRHNCSYWDDTPYLGLGVSACSYDGLNRRRTPVSIPAYIKKVSAGECPSEIELETDVDRLNDYILTSLRTSRGLSLSYVASRFALPQAISLHRRMLPFISSGHIIPAPPSSSELYEFSEIPEFSESSLSACNYRIPESRFLTSDLIIRDLLA